MALDLWEKSGGKGDLLDFVDRATDALAEGLRELEPRSAAKARGRQRAQRAGA